MKTFAYVVLAMLPLIAMLWNGARHRSRSYDCKSTTYMEAVRRRKNPDAKFYPRLK